MKKKLCDLGLQLRSEGGGHIDARLLPLSERYVLTYATPIAHACDSQSTGDTPTVYI